MFGKEYQFLMNRVMLTQQEPNMVKRKELNEREISRVSRVRISINIIRILTGKENKRKSDDIVVEWKKLDNSD